MILTIKASVFKHYWTNDPFSINQIVYEYTEEYTRSKIKSKF